MAIPSKTDFNHYIRCCEQWSGPFPRPEINKVTPNRESIESFVKECLTAANSIEDSYQSLAVTKWLENQPNYDLAMKSIFDGPREELTENEINPVVEFVLLALQDMTDAEYGEYLQYKNQQLVDMERRDQFELEEYRRDSVETDGRYSCKPRSSKEFREAFVNIQPLAGLNSEEGKKRRFRNRLMSLFRTNQPLWQWRKHLAECLLEYFHGAPDFEDLSRNKQRQELGYYSEVMHSTIQLLEYLTNNAVESEQQEFSGESFIGQTYFQGEVLPSFMENTICGPPIIKDRRFVRELEFVLKDIEENVYLKKLIINRPVTRRRDATMPERALIYSLWRFFQMGHYFSYKRNVNAFSYILSLEGIKNQLDNRTIDRLISQWENQQ